MPLIPINLDLLREDLSTLVKSLNDLSSGLAENKEEFRRIYESEKEGPDFYLLPSTFEEYYDNEFERSWGRFKIARTRILAQLDGDFNLLAIGEEEREELYQLYNLLRNFDGLTRPESSPEGKVTYGYQDFQDRVRHPLVLLAGLLGGVGGGQACVEGTDDPFEFDPNSVLPQISADNSRIFWRGDTYPDVDFEACMLLRELIDAYPEAIKISNDDRQQPKRVIKKLPPPIQKLIVAKRGKGTRLEI